MNSAQNLIHYRALRTINITSLQKKLGELGLSRITSAESHVLSTLQDSKFILSTLISKRASENIGEYVSIKKAGKVISFNTCYVQASTVLELKGRKKFTRVKGLPGIIQSIRLKKGEPIRILKKQVLGRPNVLNSNGEITKPLIFPMSGPVRS